MNTCWSGKYGLRLLPGTSSRLCLWEDGKTLGRRCSACKASRRWRSEFGPPVALPSRYLTWSRRACSASGWAVCGPLHQEGAKRPGAHELAHRETVGCHCSHYFRCCCTLCTPRAGSDHHDHPGHCCPLPGLCCPSRCQAHPGCHQNLQGCWAEAREARSLVLGRREGVREASRLDGGRGGGGGRAELQQHISANRRRQISSITELLLPGKVCLNAVLQTHKMFWMTFLEAFKIKRVLLF